MQLCGLNPEPQNSTRSLEIQSLHAKSKTSNPNSDSLGLNQVPPLGGGGAEAQQRVMSKCKSSVSLSSVDSATGSLSSSPTSSVVSNTVDHSQHQASTPNQCQIRHTQSAPTITYQASKAACKVSSVSSEQQQQQDVRQA